MGWKLSVRVATCVALLTIDDWQALLRAHGMMASMSGRGNCHDNTVAESLFSLLKSERIQRRI